jgi:hypothetical protein
VSVKSIAIGVLVGSLQACALLGPGASSSGDDQEEEDNWQTSVNSPPPVIIPPGASGSGAGTGGTGTSEQSGWYCSESSLGASASCMCNLGASSNGTPCVQAYSCCLTTSATHCECRHNDACAEYAASIPGSAIVAHCPPGAQVQCADPGENCGGKYLADQKLAGCCDGLVCKTTAPGVRTCQPASAEEQALAVSCNAPFTDILMMADLEAAAPLQIADAAIQFGAVTMARVDTGAGGCLASLQLTLATDPPSGCTLQLATGAAGNTAGELTIASGSASGSSCGGTIGGNRVLVISGGTLRFTGVTCENGPFGRTSSLGLESWCFAGTFALTLDGTFTGSGADPVTFQGAELPLAGRACSLFPTTQPCPTPAP